MSPITLDDAPLLVPGHGAAIRGQIDFWLNEADLNPCIMGEFDDGTLMKAFGQAVCGFFPGPALLTDEICARYAVEMVGQVYSIRETFWLITTERRIHHPAMLTVVEAARLAMDQRHAVAV